MPNKFNHLCHPPLNTAMSLGRRLPVATRSDSAFPRISYSAVTLWTRTRCVQCIAEHIHSWLRVIYSKTDRYVPPWSLLHLPARHLTLAYSNMPSRAHPSRNFSPVSQSTGSFPVCAGISHRARCLRDCVRTRRQVLTLARDGPPTDIALPVPRGAVSTYPPLCAEMHRREANGDGARETGEAITLPH